MADKRSLAFSLLGDGKSLGNALKGVAGEADHAHHSLSRLSKLAIGAGVVGGAVLLTKKLKDVGDETVGAYTKAAKGAGALQRVLGGSVEDASRLGFAAHETGVQEDSFAKSVKLLEKNLVNATKAQVVKTKASHQEIVTVNRLKDGHIVHVKALKTLTDVTSRTVKVSKDLGFTYKDAHGKLLPMRDILLNVSDTFKGMENGPAKTALALKLFGRAGTDMLPFLNKGRDGIRELLAESDKLGHTMSTKDVKAVKEYTLQQRHFHAAIDGLKITLGRELFPIFTAWSDSLAKNAPKLIVWTQSHLPAFRKEAGKVAAFIKDDLEPAASHMFDKLVDGGKKIDQTAGPFFRYIGEHPDMFKTIAKDVAIVGGVLKARSFLTGLGLLKGGGSGLGGGLAGGGGKPTPVFVTNPGFGAGGAVGPAGGAATTAAAASRAVPVAAIGTAAIYETNKAYHAHPKGFYRSDGPIENTLFGKRPKNDPWAKMSYAELEKQADLFKNSKTQQATYRHIVELLEGGYAHHTPGYQRSAAIQRDLRSDDPKVAARAHQTITNVTNHFTINATSVDPNAIIAEAKRQARISALSGQSTVQGRGGKLAT